MSSAAGQKGWWRTALYLEICFIICCLTSEPLGSEGQVLGSGHALPAQAYWHWYSHWWWFSPRACTRCKQTTRCPIALYLKFLLWTEFGATCQRCQPGFSIWGKATSSTISLQYYAKGAVWYVHHSGMCFLPTYTWAYSKLLQPIQKKITTTVRGYCLPETPKSRKANISWLLTQEISNLRLLEGWRPHQSKDHSVPHLIFCLHQWPLCILKTGYRATGVLAWPRKSVLIKNKGMYFTAWTAAGSTHASLLQSGNKEWSWKGNMSFTLDLQPSPRAQVPLTDKQECSCGHSGFQSIWAATHVATREKSAVWDAVCWHMKTDVPKTRLGWRPQNTLRLTSPSLVQGLAPDFQHKGSEKIPWYQVLEQEEGKHLLPLQITSMMVTFGDIQRTTSVLHKCFNSGPII